MEEREIRLKELFDVIWKGKWIIAVAAIAAFVIAAAGSFIYDGTKSKVVTIVTMQWDGVGEGEYPDGSRFDYANAIEATAITFAVDAQGLSLTTNEVRNAMTLSPIVPNDVLVAIQSAIENGEELSYFPTDYRFTLDNGKLGISVQEASELINEIINQFKADFERKFIYQMSVLDFTATDFDEYDFLDIYDILDTQVKAINSLMEPRSEFDFYSPTLGLTFNDILVRTEIVERIELTQVITRTNNYLLTKDKAYLVTNYQYKIEQAKLAVDKAIAKEIKDAYDLKLCEIGVIVGGGNIFRGKIASEMGIERSSADYMGMIGTILNALALQNSLESLGVQTRVMTSLNIPEVAEPYIRRKALSHFQKGKIVIFGGGTGNPYFSTDTTAALRAAELGASIIYMAKNGVDGVYDKDPRKDSTAKKYATLTNHELLQKELQVMDSTAAALCHDNNIDLYVFDMNVPGNISKAILGEDIGTKIINKEE